MNRIVVALALATVATAASSAPTNYTVDPDHTHPSFEVDHFGGLSVWRGTFKKSAGKVVLDATAQTGSVEINVDTASIDLAHDKLNEHASSAEILDAARFPTATYKATLGGFKNGAPTLATGTLTLHGVTKPLTLKIDSFKCMQNPMSKKDVCGADATGTFNRADFGVNYGQQYGFSQEVAMRIQVEPSRPTKARHHRRHLLRSEK
jgi:polyisoprenoid-binding protein YceI